VASGGEGGDRGPAGEEKENPKGIHRPKRGPRPIDGLPGPLSSSKTLYPRRLILKNKITHPHPVARIKRREKGWPHTAAGQREGKMSLLSSTKRVQTFIEGGKRDSPTKTGKRERGVPVEGREKVGKQKPLFALRAILRPKGKRALGEPFRGKKGWDDTGSVNTTILGERSPRRKRKRAPGKSETIVLLLMEICLIKKARATRIAPQVGSRIRRGSPHEREKEELVQKKERKNGPTRCSGGRGGRGITLSIDRERVELS